MQDSMGRIGELFLSDVKCFSSIEPPAALPLPEGGHLLFRRSEKDRICKNWAKESTLKAAK